MESDFYLAFSVAPGIGPKRFLLLIQQCKTAEKAWSAGLEDYASVGIGEATYEKFNIFRQKFNIVQYRQLLSVKRVQFISQTDSDYPKSLLNLSNPPIGLFVKGNTECLKSLDQSIAVVGSRKMTEYGRQVTKLFASTLADHGLTIVSGLALGVDAIAHRSAIEAKDATIAVLGNGVDMPYPKENSLQYSQILEKNGCIISEYPLGAPATKGSFPARNRIIAALATATLVTEAGKDSGSLITAKEAAKLGKKVYAVPGPITSTQSHGTAELIRGGAVLVASPQEILHDLAIVQPTKKTLQLPKTLSVTERKVLTLLTQEEMTLDVLSKRSNLPIWQLSQIMSGFELAGYVKNVGHGKFVAEL